MKAHLERYGFAAAIAFLYLYSFPYFEDMKNANEQPRVYLVQAMADEGTFAIDTGMRKYGSSVDVSPHAGHQYSNKAPGQSFLAVPPYLLLKGVRALFGQGPPGYAETLWVSRVVTGVIPQLLFLLLLWRFFRRFAPDPAVRRLVIAAYALGTMAMPYAVLFHSHQLSAVCICSSFILIVWAMEDELDDRWMFAAGLLAGCAPFVDYQAAFAGVPVAIYLLWKCLGRGPRRWRPVLYAAAGAAIPIAVLLYYHSAAFGGPFVTGYELSKNFDFHHQKGFLGMDKPRWEAFYGSTVGPNGGLVFFCPMVLLAFWGWVVMALRKQWWMFGITLSIAVIYIMFVTSLNFWHGGWSIGPRYITAMLPFVMVPIAVAVSEAWKSQLLRSLVIGLMLVGIVVYTLSTALYPHFPEDKYPNPLFEITFKLLLDGWAAHNLGSGLGLTGFASLVPYLLVLAAVVGWCLLPARAMWRSAAGGVAVAALVLVGYSFIPRGGFIEWRSYTCFIAGVMPDQPEAGATGGPCGPGRGCDAGNTCYSCDGRKRICLDSLYGKRK